MTEEFSDHRLVEGLMIPHKTTTNIPSIGGIVAIVKTIKFDVDIPETTFRAPDKK